MTKAVHKAAFILLLPLFLSTAYGSGYIISGATLTLTNAAVLTTESGFTLAHGSLITNGAALYVSGDWTRTGGSFALGTSTVTLEGFSASTFIGSTTFYALRCVTAGKELNFQAGSTQTVTGALILTGSAGQLIRIRSTVPGSHAYWVNSGTNAVTFVDSQDNNASGGQAIRSGSNSQDSGNNRNWSFGEPAPANAALSAVHITSITATWNSVKAIDGYRLEASTRNTFDEPVLSSVTVSTSATSLTLGSVTPLAINTVYFLRVSALYNGTSTYASLGSTRTRVGGPPPNSIYETHITSISVSWDALPYTTGYQIDVSTSINFSGVVHSSGSDNPLITTLAITSLSLNTTYYLRLGALYNGATTFTSLGPTRTIPGVAPDNPQLDNVHITSASVSWNTVPYATDYQVDASTASDFTGTLFSTAAGNALATALTVTSLSVNTTYYLRIGALYNGAGTYINLGSTRTYVGNAPTNHALHTVFVTSMSVSWNTALHATGYQVDASTSADFTGVTFSSITTSPMATTLAVRSLSSNTTYYVRTGALYNGATVFSLPDLSSVTLTQPIVGAHFADIFVGSITVNWLPLASAQGYRLEASTTPTFLTLAGSSSTTDIALSTLTLTGLTGNTNYFFRVGGLNWNGVPHFVFAGAATAGVGASPFDPRVSQIAVSSLTVSWVTVPNTSGYILAASTASDFSGTIISSTTSDPMAVELTVGSNAALTANTTYFLRIGALYSGATSYTQPQPEQVSTLSQALTGVQVSQIYSTSVTVTWTPQSNTQGYRLDASTASDFTAHLSEITTDVFESSLTITGLTANTLYFFRIGSLNWAAVTHYAAAGNITTPLGPAPINPTIIQVLVSSITVSWGSVNADDGYRLEASTASNFTGTLFSSGTLDGNATTLTLQGLGPNLSYFLRVGSIWNGGVNYALTTPASTTTLIVLTNGIPARPSAVTGAYLGVGGAFVLSWREVTQNTFGSLTPIGYYVIERSTEVMGGYVPIAQVPSSTFTYTDITNGVTRFYRARAADVNNNLSEPSDVVDSTPESNRYILAEDTSQTRLIIPATINVEMLGETNALGDIDIRFIRQPQDEGGDVLLSYSAAAYRADTGEVIPNFSFSKTQMTVIMDYLTAPQASSRPRRVPVPPGMTVAPYWINGAIPVPLANPSAPSNEPLSMNVRNLGVYQVRITQPASAGLRLLPGSPYPRILTPNRENENRRLFFFFSNPGGLPVTATIYDIRGAKVRDLSLGSLSPTSNSLVWDVRNSHGNIVPSGIYVYKLQAGGETLTGTVVVAR